MSKAVGAVSVQQTGPKGKEQLKPEPVKIKRYWPGQQVDEDADEESDEREDLNIVFGGKATGIVKQEKKKKPEKKEVAASVIKVSQSTNSIQQKHVQPTPSVVKPAVTQQKQIEEEDDDEITDRRERLRQKYLQKKAEEERIRKEEELNQKLKLLEAKKRAMSMLDSDEEEGEDDEEESEGEEESEEEEILKPVFIPKEHRETIFEAERKREEEQRREAKRLQQLAERKEETKELVKEVLKREEMDEKNKNVDHSDEELPDDEDIESELQKEFEAWKLREKARVHRERRERKKREKEQAEIERRRRMTDRERQLDKEEWERKHGIKKKEKKKWNFLQKYYHKGAFFQDTDETGKKDEIYEIDYAAYPTLEDKFNKKLLPKVLQVKNFGKVGRTKYTHLVDQDTTDWTGPRYEPRRRNDYIDRPSKRRKSEK